MIQRLRSRLANAMFLEGCDFPKGLVGVHRPASNTGFGDIGVVARVAAHLIEQAAEPARLDLTGSLAGA